MNPSIALEAIATERRPSRNGHGVLVSLTRPWSGASLLDFLRQWTDRPRVYWEGGSTHGEPHPGFAEARTVGFAGCGVAAVLSAEGAGRFESVREQVVQLFDHAIVEKGAAPPIVGPRLFGGFAFRAAHGGQGIWSAFPAACFLLPRYQLTRCGRWTWVTVNQLLEPGEEPRQVLRQLEDEIHRLTAVMPTNDGRNGNRTTIHRLPSIVHRSPWQDPEPPVPFAAPLTVENLVSPEVWHRLVTTATHRIQRGELAKVVLAQACRARSPHPVDPVAVLVHLRHNYPECYRFLIEPVPGHAFYGATPELLAEVSGSIVRTVALAGSIRRGRSPEEDAVLGEQLMASPKDRHEHALVVEAVQEALLPLVTKLYVPGTPELYRLSNIQHLRTVIRGELAKPCGVLPVVEALHPTPAVGGSPREIALRLIAEAEPFPRGWYASPVGWLDPQGNGLFAVALRSAVSAPHRTGTGSRYGVGCETWLFAGAGIVADSHPAREWEEVGLKLRPMLEALQRLEIGY